MVTKFADIDKTVAQVIAMHEHLPEGLSASSVAHYTIMKRAAPISGEIIRFLLSEQNRGTPDTATANALLELIAVNLSNMLVNGGDGLEDRDEAAEERRHDIVHQIIDQLSLYLHRNLHPEESEAILGSVVEFTKKEVGDA